jgi:hypothetical protein
MGYWRRPLDRSSPDARSAGHRLVRQEHPTKRTRRQPGWLPSSANVHAGRPKVQVTRVRISARRRAAEPVSMRFRAGPFAFSSPAGLPRAMAQGFSAPARHRQTRRTGTRHPFRARDHDRSRLACPPACGSQPRSGMAAGGNYS